MRNTAATLAAVLMALACGGEAESDVTAPEPQQPRLLYIDADGSEVFGFPEGSDDAGDVGSLEQPLVFAPAGAIQPGVRTDGTEIVCTPQSPNQNCVIPRFKAIRWIPYGNPGSQMTQVTNQVNAWYNDMVAKGLSQASDGWLFSQATDINDRHLTLVVDVNPGTGFCAGDSTKGLSCMTGSTTGVQPLSGLVGTYHTWQEGTVPVLHIDIGEILGLPGLTAQQKTNLVHQAVWSGLVRFGGLGLMQVGDDRCYSQTRQPNQTCVNRTQTACFFNGFGDAGNTSSVWIGGSNCGT
jgi:hypothetical protein